MTDDEGRVQTRMRGGIGAGLDRGRILEAARVLPRSGLSMQAVADSLGVDRKALHYHVEGREGLLELVALDLFSTRFADVDIPFDDWRSACRAFATGMATALIETGELINSFSMDDATLHVIDQLLTTLRAAGFDDELAKRGLVMLTTLAMGSARDRVLATRAGGHPRHLEWQRSLSHLSEGSSSAPPSAIIGPDLDVDDESQLQQSIEVFLLGMDQKLRS